MSDYDDVDTTERVKRTPKPPIRGARLNSTYCLVKLTYYQAQMLYAVAEHADPRAEGDFSSHPRSMRDLQAFLEAMDKLKETQERWPWMAEAPR